MNTPIKSEVNIESEIKVFMIDDEIDAVNMFSRYIKKARDKYNLTCITDPLKAITKIQSIKPNIILLDYEMPEMNGLELFNEIQKLDNPPPVIFLTAYPEFKQQAVDTGAVDYFVKARTEFKILVERIDLVLLEQHPNDRIIASLSNRYKDELTQMDINLSDISSICIELTKDGVIREIISENCHQEKLDSLIYLKDQLIGIDENDPLFIFDNDILNKCRSIFVVDIGMILAQPLNITHSRHGIWLIYGLKSNRLISKKNLPFFSHWAKFFKGAVEEYYRMKISRDHAVTMLRRSAAELTRLGLGLGQLNEQNNELYEIRVELEKNTREMNLLATALKPENKDSPKRNLSEITQQIVNKNKAWAEINNIGIRYEYQLNTENGGPLLNIIEWSFVVNALISNAIDVFLYEDENSDQSQKVLVQLRYDKDHVILNVFNNGQGICKDIKDKLVQQGWSTKGMHRGWGLYLSNEICQKNQVLLEFESPGDDTWSTRFCLIFPD